MLHDGGGNHPDTGGRQYRQGLNGKGKADSRAQRRYDAIGPISRMALVHFVDLKNNFRYEDYGDLLDYIRRAGHWLKRLRASRDTRISTLGVCWHTAAMVGPRL